MTEVISTKFEIPDSGEPVITHTTQYGMRFPDGTIQWQGMSLAPGRPIQFEDLHKRTDYRTTTWWDDYLKAKSAGAHLDPGEYGNQHQIVKRTVVLALTEAEDV